MFNFFIFRKKNSYNLGQVKIIEILLNTGRNFGAKGRNYVGTPLIIGLKNGKTWEI